ASSSGFVVRLVASWHENTACRAPRSSTTSDLIQRCFSTSSPMSPSGPTYPSRWSRLNCADTATQVPSRRAQLSVYRPRRGLPSAERELKRAWMIAKSPSKRIRTSSATSPLIVTGCAVSSRNSALSSSEPSGFEPMKSSARISSKRFTSPFCTDAKKSRFRAVSVSRSRCAFAFVCMAISLGVRRFLVQLRNEALIFDPQEFNTDWDFAIRAIIRVPDDELLPSFLKHRVSADVQPIVLLRWNVARLAVGPVIGRHVPLGVLRFEQRPAPPVAPQVVLGEPPLRVLDHHKPNLDVRGPGGLSRREFVRADLRDL